MGQGRGVEVRAKSIRLHFSSDGVMHRKTLSVSGRPLAPTPANVKYAQRLAAEIRERIRHGTFSVAEYFPEDGVIGRGLTVHSQLDAWLASQRLAASTRKAYRSAARFWVDAIGEQQLRQLKLSQVMTALAEADISGKTANNYTSVLRKAIDLAVADGVVQRNIVDEVPAQAHQRPPADPLSQGEEDALVSAMEAIAPGLADEVRFRCWTGLRTGEHVALTWGQVDLERGRMLVDRSIVRGVEKGTKTDHARTVRLNSISSDCLRRQAARAGGHDRVWLDPRYGQPWADPEMFRELYWAPAMAAAGVRYRRPYVCRHTYATRMLMAGMRPAFCAAQMGHGVQVFIEIYSRWIDGAGDDAEMALLERRIPSTSPEPTPSAEGDGSRIHPAGAAGQLETPPGVPATYGGADAAPPGGPINFPENFPGDAMIVDEAIEIIERTKKHLVERDPDYAQHPAIIVAPDWWLEKVKAYAGVAGTDQEVESLCDCKVIRQSDAGAPALVAHDGRAWNLLPKWLRADQAREAS